MKGTLFWTLNSQAIEYIQLIILKIWNAILSMKRIISKANFNLKEFIVIYYYICNFVSYQGYEMY